jgi:hypothetical protein
MQSLHAESVSRAATGTVCLEHGASMLLTADGDFARFRKPKPITLQEFGDRRKNTGRSLISPKTGLRRVDSLGVCFILIA